MQIIDDSFLFRVEKSQRKYIQQYLINKCRKYHEILLENCECKAFLNLPLFEFNLCALNILFRSFVIRGLTGEKAGIFI